MRNKLDNGKEKIKVLYIGGYSRSGSTLLLRLLGQIEGFVGVGEVWDIWHRSFTENQLCGCGQQFRDCSFWKSVVEEVFGGFDQVDIDRMQAMRDSVQGNRYIPFLALPHLRPQGYQERFKKYTEILNRLYLGIHRVSEGKIIIDSSKVPSYAFVLRDAANIDLNIVHLVRDSRATAYSWQRKKVRPEIYWKKTYMEQYSPIRSALEWGVMNGLFHALDYTGVKYVRVRYEDLVHQPYASIARMLSSLKLPVNGVNLLKEHNSIHLGVDHTVSGNPNRFQQGTIKIKPDIEWQKQMPSSHKRMVTALTWPLLLDYGYLTQKQARNGHETKKATNGRSTNQNGHAKSTPLRILLATARYLPFVGGTEIHTYEIARRLVSYGHQVTILTTDLDGMLPENDMVGGIRIKRVRAWPQQGDYYFAPQIYREITSGHWDIIHCQGYHTLVAPLVMLAARKSKIPYLVTFHSGGHSSWIRQKLRPIQQTLLRPLLAQADGLIAVSHWEANHFSKRLHLPEDRITVIPNGSYLVKSRKNSTREQNSTLIVSVGRLERYKGHHQVITALPLVAEQFPSVRLRIVGTGPYEETLRRLAKEAGVANRVDIKPIEGGDREGMAAIMMGAALVILLSNYESQGISAMEALALGRPVLVADATALHELAASGLARATPLGSTHEEVAMAIMNQLRRPLIPEATNLPTWQDCADKVLNLYQHTINHQVLCES